MARRRSHAFLALLGLFFVVAAGALHELAPAQADEPPQSGLVDYHEGARPLQDLSLISDRNREQLATASELIDFNKADFAGVYVRKDSQLVIVAATARGAELAAETFQGDAMVTVERVSFSLEAVNQLGYDLYRTFPNVGEKTYDWAINAATGALVVGINIQLGESEKADIEQFARDHQLSIQVYLDENAKRAAKDDSRLEDDSPYAGGFRYTMQSSGSSSASGTGYCSGGFGYASGGSNYMITAGHCFERGTARPYMWNTQSGSCCVKKAYAGKDNATSWNDGVGTVSAGNDSGIHGDLAIVNVDVAGKDSGDHIWWDGVTSPNRVPVTGRRNPTLGDPICINGVSSGADCGLQVVETNMTAAYDDGDVLRNGDRGSSSSDADCSQNGDSGGSVVYDHSGVETHATAEGIISGHYDEMLGGCQQYFTGIEEAIQAWGGNVKFY